MDLFECYTYEEDIIDETGFTRIRPQGYSRLKKQYTDVRQPDL